MVINNNIANILFVYMVFKCLSLNHQTKTIMKTTEYNVIYLNGNEEYFYCFGFVEAIILAMAHAQSKGWDMRIKYISDEKGTTIKDIEYPKYKYSI